MGRKCKTSGTDSEYAVDAREREELLRQLRCAIQTEMGTISPMTEPESELKEGKPQEISESAAKEGGAQEFSDSVANKGESLEFPESAAVNERGPLDSQKFIPKRGEHQKPAESVADLLWKVLLQYQKEPFYTVKGLEFTYYIKGNELFVSRKDKSITRASVEVALQKAMNLNLVVSGPKKLTSFGASYLYPIFLKLDIICAQA